MVTGIERTHCRAAAVIFIDGPGAYGLTRGKMDIPSPSAREERDGTYSSLRLLETTPTDFHRSSSTRIFQFQAPSRAESELQSVFFWMYFDSIDSKTWA